MKIGILTHPLDYNYGCLLQAYALQKTLINMGHEVVTINRYSDPNLPFMILLKSWVYRFAMKITKGAKVSLVWNKEESLRTKDILSTNTQKFVDRNIINTGRVLPKDLPGIDDKYQFDAYVVGSDQVWLPHFSLNSFLDFVHRDNVRKVFYAASSGKMSFADIPELAVRCKSLCEGFSGISVRESSLINVARESLGREAIQVLDPTLLLRAQDYLDVCVEKTEPSPIVFTYLLDKTADKKTIVNRVSEDLQLPIVNGSVENDYKKGQKMDISKCIYPSVDHWLLNLNRAKFVVTDSFHGTCMSIIFNKPFVVIGNENRGIDRFLSVLEMFGLQDRLIMNNNDFTPSVYDSLPVQSINSVLEAKRKESLDFLMQNLS